MIHKFDESLQKSHDAEDLPFWEECYRNAFGDQFAGMISHRQDGEHQRAGIDRSVILTNSRQILIDEKVRWRNYGDILLEHTSNDRTGSPGWVRKPLRADYIAYAIAPKGVCYLLPTIQLQKAWLEHGDGWQTEYGEKRAANQGYSTLNTPVPVDVLFRAMGSYLRVQFTPVSDILS